MSMTTQRLTCLGPHGFFQLASVRWDAPSKGGRPVVCVHGLTRNGRDFDTLAERLSLAGPVVAPDMPGRGQSDWMNDKADYGYPLYMNAVAALIGTLGVDEVDYVGTSMGGIIGMFLASLPNAPIRRMVLNDVGPLVPKAALERIGSYVGQDPEFNGVDELERYLRTVAASFGPLTDTQWRHMAEHGQRRLPNGKIGLAYDPAIALPFRGEVTDVDFWPIYDRIKCPTLVIRGGVSDLLLAETAQEMTRRGPKAELYEVAGVGHAPALMADDQTAVIERFFQADIGP
jgi:pimeloyl-ACP methyl ester carboxylesterase